jgi:hypothetical protein
MCSLYAGNGVVKVSDQVPDFVRCCLHVGREKSIPLTVIGVFTSIMHVHLPCLAGYELSSDPTGAFITGVYAIANLK